MEECTYHWHHQHNHRFLAYVYAMIAFPWLSRFGHIILQMFLSKSGCWMRLFLFFSNTVPSYASWINDLSNMMFFSFFLSRISHGTRETFASRASYWLESHFHQSIIYFYCNVFYLSCKVRRMNSRGRSTFFFSINDVSTFLQHPVDKIRINDLST